MNEDIFRGVGIEVSLPTDPEQSRAAFLKIRETLTRIGVASRKEKILYQSAHILHKRGRYAIVHFKELFSLDGKSTDFSDDDKGRRNTIVALLEEWGLLKIVSQGKLDTKAPMNHIKVLNYDEKKEWTLQPKYSVGAKKKKE